MNLEQEALYKKKSVALIRAMVGTEHADKWWSSPNKGFQNKTPEQQWDEDYLTVYNYICRHAEGEW